MLLTIGAVVAGFLTMAVVVILTTALASKVMLPRTASPDRTPAPSGAYIAVNLACALLAAWLGGMVTARITQGDPTSVQILAGVVLLMGVASALGAPKGSGQPTWYLWSLPVIGAVGVLVGGGVIP